MKVLVSFLLLILPLYAVQINFAPGQPVRQEEKVTLSFKSEFEQQEVSSTLQFEQTVIWQVPAQAAVGGYPFELSRVLQQASRKSTLNGVYEKNVSTDNPQTNTTMQKLATLVGKPLVVTFENPDQIPVMEKMQGAEHAYVAMDTLSEMAALIGQEVHEGMVLKWTLETTPQRPFVAEITLTVTHVADEEVIAEITENVERQRFTLAEQEYVVTGSWKGTLKWNVKNGLLFQSEGKGTTHLSAVYAGQPIRLTMDVQRTVQSTPQEAPAS